MNEKPIITVEDDWQYCVKYRFSDDPEDMIREWLEPPIYNLELGAYEILPPFPNKSVIVIGFGAVQK